MNRFYHSSPIELKQKIHLSNQVAHHASHVLRLKTEDKIILFHNDPYYYSAVITQINKKRVEEFIRVDHAGERGAVKIYEGQLLALNSFVKDESLKKTIEEMKVHEKEHCEFFENEIKKRNIKPTKFLPLWDLLGVGLGFGSTLLGKKAAMLCTASVEEVIDEHYLNQINQLDNNEKFISELESMHLKNDIVIIMSNGNFDGLAAALLDRFGND